MTITMQLSRKLAIQLLNLAQQSPDMEICGLIGHKNNIPLTCYPIDNVALESSDHFLLNTKQHILAMKSMRENEEQLFAVYHSHPNAAAFPSLLDLDMSPNEAMLHFIISLNVKGILELRAFRIENKKAIEIMLGL